ncbi:MAG: hypothetical protein JKY19_02295 [Alcanivoracaceae bacterium]|nr:hypothetical protein [Alcanivoracaceae bacterium]
MNKLLILLLFSCFNVFAQTQLPATHHEKSNATSKSQNQGGIILTSSLGGVLPGATAANSQNYLDGVLGGYNNSGADDVNIPACESWSVNLVEVAGNYSDPLMVGSLGPAVSVSVYIFQDLPGEPDQIDYASALYVYEGLNYTEISTGDFRIDLPTDAILQGGLTGSTYWIAVRANLAILSGGQWGWSESAIDLGSNVSQWQQSNAGPLTGINDCVMDWKDRGTCALLGTNNQLAFALEGQILTKGITVNPTMINLIEGGVGADFDVSLNAPSCDTVDITIAGNDATETSISSSLLSFNSGNWDIPQTVTLTPLTDGINDGDSSYSLTSTASSVGDAGYNSLTGTNVDVMVANIDGIATILVSPSSGITVDEAGTMTQVVNFSATTMPTADVTIDLTNNSPSEVSLSTTSVVLTAGNGYSANVTITGVTDNIVEPTQAFLISTDAAVSSDVAFAGLDPVDITGMVTDNNTAIVIVSPNNTPLQTSEAGLMDTIDYVLSAQPSDNVIFSLFVTDSSEGILSDFSLTFTPVNWNDVQTVTVTGQDDSIDDGDVNYTISSSTTSSLDTTWDGLPVSSVSATNTDNDTAMIMVTPSQSPIQTSETGTTDSIDYVLTAEPLADVSFSLSISDNTEASASDNMLTFTPANWDTVQTVTVTGLDDNIADGNQNYTVDASNATSTDLAWNGLSVIQVSGTNADDEGSAMVVVTPDQSPIQTSEAGGTASIQYVLSSQPGADVSFSLSVSDPDEAMVSPSMLTFTPANWNQVQVVVVTGVDDNVNDANNVYTINASDTVSTDPIWNGITIPPIEGVNIGIRVIPMLNLWSLLLLVLLMFIVLKFQKQKFIQPMKK